MSLSFAGTAEPGKVINGLLSVNDENGNIATQDFKVRIRPISDELIAKDDENHPVEEEQVPESDSGPVQEFVQPQQPVQEPVYTPAPDLVQKPANRSFLFSEGYDMGNVEGACSAAGDASGYGYSCIPIVGNDGIYLGMDLIFN